MGVSSTTPALMSISVEMRQRILELALKDCPQVLSDDTSITLETLFVAPDNNGRGLRNFADCKTQIMLANKQLAAEARPLQPRAFTLIANGHPNDLIKSHENLHKNHFCLIMRRKKEWDCRGTRFLEHTMAELIAFEDECVFIATDFGYKFNVSSVSKKYGQYMDGIIKVYFQVELQINGWRSDGDVDDWATHGGLEDQDESAGG